jgi:hypothetical protein
VLYVFILLVGLASVGVYLLFIFSQVPGAAEERLGVLEPLPENLGQWIADGDSAEGRRAAAEGFKREVRTLHEAGGILGGGKLIRQVRYRSAETNAIVRIEPEQVEKRRRLHKKA